jgi:S-methylmethionine-dependent homocysteine/selenocysteine methylase
MDQKCFMHAPERIHLLPPAPATTIHDRRSFSLGREISFFDMNGARDIVLLDGGTSLELLSRSQNKAPRHWSAEYLLTEPSLVRDVHLDYIRAGAKVITTNTYSSTFTRMAMVNAEGEVPRLTRVACELAREAREMADKDGEGVLIAGCLPPLNGTYRPDRVREFDVNLAEYRRLTELLSPHVDLFLCETMSTGEEARAAALAASETGKPVWVAWSLKDQHPTLRSGETIAEAAAMLDDLKISAALANCSPPELVSKAVPALVETGLPAGGYANAFAFIPLTFAPGRTKEQLTTRRDLGPARYAAFAMDWVAKGASIVGGCCEVGPDHIALIRDHLRAGGHRIVASPTDPPPEPAFGKRA